MQSWEETFLNLKEKYIQRSRSRVEQIARLVDEMAAEPADLTYAGRLKHHFHWLTGSGAIYGMPKITEMGSCGEQHCEKLLQDKQPAGPQDMQYFQELLDGIRAEFALNQPAASALPAAAPQSVQAAPAQTAPAPSHSAPVVPQPGTVAGHQAAGACDKEGYRILCVEDDPDQAAYLKAVLEQAGYQACCIADPGQFEHVLVDYDPHLVLMDILLPGVNGFELTQYVRQQERYATLPVIFLTTQVQLASRIEAARSGGDDYLTKPVLPPLLLSTLAARLERACFLKSLLHRDGLTRVLTRAAFMERAAAVAADCKRHPERHAVMIMIDVAGLKTVNDDSGPGAGDKVLCALADLMRSRLRQSDTIGRVSGDVFGAVAEDIDEVQGQSLAGRLLVDFSQMAVELGQYRQGQVTLTAGVAVLDPYTMHLDNWCTAAQQALSAARAGGDNCVRGASVSTTAI